MSFSFRALGASTSGNKSTFMPPKRNSSRFSESILAIMSSKSINLLANESGGLYQVPTRNGLECGFVISIIRHSRLSGLISHLE